MIIDNFNIVYIPVTPGETDTPLPVDANAVLTLSVSVQGFKMIARRDPKGFLIHCSFKHIQFPQRDPFYGAKFPARSFCFELPSLFAFIVGNHDLPLS